MKSIIRKALPPKTFLTELERYQSDLDNRTKMQALYKEINAYLRKKPTAQQVADRFNYKLSTAIDLLIPDYGNKVGLPAYILTNNLANIKRLEKRVREMQEKEDRSNNIGEESFDFVGGKVVLNHSEDRVQVFHDAKPPKETIEKMKSNGFHWSPSIMAWQRQLTIMAVYAANGITGTAIKL